MADEDIQIVDISSTSDSSPVRTPSAKRKAEDAPVPASILEKKARSSLIELQPRKLVFSQEPYQRGVPRRRLLNFEAWLLDAEEEGTAPTSIPDEFYDVIAMAGHELMSNTEASFLKSLKSELVKVANGLLTDKLLAPVVAKLFEFKQYGFLPSDFGVTASKLPLGLQIRCWEVKDIASYFPADRVSDLLARRAVRERAREECVGLIAGMGDDEKAAILKGEKIVPKSVTETPKKVVPEEKIDVEMMPASSPLTTACPSTSRKSREGTVCSEASRRSLSPSRVGKKLTAEEEEAAKKRTEEREAKRIEREEKRKEKEEKQAAKERAAEKKAQVKAKQAKMFGAFFAKPQDGSPKAGSSSASAGDDLPGVSPLRPKSRKDKNDFHRMFMPPPQRANVEWAPLNRWKSRLSQASSGKDTSMWSSRDFLDDHLRRFHFSTRNPRSDGPSGLKSFPVHGTVADKWQAYQDAEDPRAVLAELRDASKFPWKTLSFDQQARPPYCGTFTKRSVAVGGRTPFAQDPIFDYSYDSGDEWQEDEGGDDVDDAAEVVEEPEIQSDEEDGEFDDWLDDEDETVLEVDTTAKKQQFVPKRVTKVTPTWLGPVWESCLGAPTEGMEQYSIQLLNDTPDGFDPFLFEASDPVQVLKPVYTTMAVGMQTGVRTLESVDLARAPQVKPAVVPMPLGDASSSANQPTTEKKRIQPKVAFPSAHLAELLKIVDGNTKIFTDLIATLRERFDKVTTKVAIEAKIREVAIREGRTKDSAWRVKAEAWTEAGISPPAKAVATNGSI